MRQVFKYVIALSVLLGGSTAGWGMKVQSNLGTNATVKWYDYGTTAPAAGTFSATAPGTELVAETDYSLGGHYIVMHITPADGYWTDEQLLVGIDTNAELARRRTPGVDVGNIVKLLAADEGHSDGTGWYYYQIPAAHNSFINTIVDGYVVEKFMLSSATVSTDGMTFAVDNGAGWSTEVSVEGKSFTYNGTAQGPQLKGTTFKVKKGSVEACEISTLTAQFSFSGIETAVGSHSATLSGATNSCFTGSQAVAYTIGEKALTITADAKSKVYGADDPTLTYTVTGLESVDALTGALTRAEGEDAGTYAITQGTLKASSNYKVSFTGANLTITQKEVGLSWTPDPATFTYNGSAQAPMASATGTVNKEEIGVTVSISAKEGSALTDGKAVDVGDYTATATALTGTKAANYKLPAATGCDFSIGEAGITGIEVSGYTGTYDGAAHGISVTAPDGMTVKYGTKAGICDLNASPTYTDVGEATVYYEISKANYTTVTGSAKVTITQKALTITADAASKVYGADDPTLTYTATGLVGSETLTGALTRAEGENAGTYAITQGTLKASGNYDVSFTGANLTITQKEVGLSWTDVSLTYNGSAQAPTVSATGTVNDDEIGVTVSISAKEGSALTDGKAVNVGDYTATATALTGTKAANYKLPAATGCDFSISEAGITGIEVSGYTGTYDGAAHGISVTVPEGATVKYGTKADACDLNASPTYTDVCEATVYYEISKANSATVKGSATVTITKKALTITADAASKVYGADDPTLTYTQSGLVGSETLTGVLTRAEGEDAGTYAITQGTLKASDNYDVSFTGANLTITQKEVGLSWTNISLTYNGSAQAPKATATGMVNDDEIGVTVSISAKEGSALTDGKAINIGEYTATATALTGTKAANYKLPAAASCDFSISETGITGIEVSGYTGTYDGAAHGISVTVPEGATVKYGTKADACDLNASPTYTDVCEATVYYEISKANSATVKGSATVTITKKALTIVANDQTKEVGAADPTLTYTVTGLVGSETLTGALTRAEGETVGEYAITQGTLKASDNYDVSFTGAKLTITPKDDTKIVKGDANGDGVVNVADLVEMVNAIAGKASEKFILKNADIDGDGKVTQNDVEEVAKMIMN